MNQTRQGILSASLLRPEKWWYLSELAITMGVRPSTLQREVDSLTRSGILSRRTDGRRVYLKANEASPIFDELQGLFKKTIGIVPVLSGMLAPFAEKVDFAFLYGSTARAAESADSDIDLLLVADISLFALVPRLRAAETDLGRQVNPTIFTRSEFALKIKAKNHFLLTVMREKKILLKGAEHELEAIAREATAPRPRHQ